MLRADLAADRHRPLSDARDSQVEKHALVSSRRYGFEGDAEHAASETLVQDDKHRQGQDRREQQHLLGRQL